MAFPRTPGGLFPLTTAPTGNNVGGLYPTTDRLVAAIRSLAPTAYWKLDEASGNLADAMSGGYTATVTGSPTYGVAAPSPIGRGVTFSGSGQYATTATSIPTPTTSISVLALISTTNTTAGNRVITSRAGTNQYSWDLRLISAHRFQMTVWQAAAAQHGTALYTSGSVNDGAWHLGVGTFDGTTVRCYTDNLSGVSSTSLTGTWHTASTAAVRLSSLVAGNEFPGTSAHIAYWADRIITDAERLWLYSIVKGG